MSTINETTVNNHCGQKGFNRYMKDKNLENIISLGVEDIKQRLRSFDIAVCVVGLGRIGLPTTVSFAHKGLPTTGVDIDQERVTMVNSGKWPFDDEPGFDKMLDVAVKNQKLVATTRLTEAVPKSEVVLLALPTPMDKNNVPDYSALISVGKELNKLLVPGSLVIVESTVEPGFIEDKLIPVIDGYERKLKVGKDVGIAACPETANPTAILHDFTAVPRLVGATDERTTKIVAEIYRHVFSAEIIELPDCKTANAAKLTANVFRDVNIAFANELAILFEKLGIDIIKVLEACDKKYNFETHYPGAGVGGPCLPVNSYQMLSSARNMDGMLKIIKAAREINEHMPEHVIDLLIDGLKEAGKTVNDCTISILGLSYKPDVRDVQLTPAENILERLRKLGAKIKIYDPYFKATQVFNLNTESNMIDAIQNVDAAILVTAHSEFRNIEPSFLISKMNSNPVIVDARGLLDTSAVKKAGLIFRGVGRGRI
ncbi:MAG TPA: nucleotide sugar dehydrogenase [Nitrososphaerales archaeon]|nr:nucleotide sugar dehydrogenase [Nitrososphaerales archaeon]